MRSTYQMGAAKRKAHPAASLAIASADAKDAISKMKGAVRIEMRTAPA
jgi:hypothetical protein